MIRYWTTRYLATLCLGLAIIGILSTIWIRHSVTQKRLGEMEYLADEISLRISSNQAGFDAGGYMPNGILGDRRRFEDVNRHLMIAVTKANGEYVFTNPLDLPPEFRQIVAQNFATDKTVQKTSIGFRDTFYVVKKPVKADNKTVGWVVLMQPVREVSRSNEELILLGTMLSGMALLGWIVIYNLTKKLLKPIRDVADGAKRILDKDYDIKLNTDIRELELYELANSFQNMADRLRKLETLRTELLAGVTHELKTPVASMSGLVQAVKDGVVAGGEAQEFLDLSLKEADKLQKMVEDLLDFNSFSVGAISIRSETLNVSRLIKEIVHQWRIAQEDDPVSIEFNFQDPNATTVIDPLRTQQILTNLLNNAKQSKADQITISQQMEGPLISIDICDNGSGIPEEEKSLIFERFFRGKHKKHRVGGLGLGLPFSQMAARAMGGDLVLSSSSPLGSVFTLYLPGK